MSLPRFIPKEVFQALAILSLIVALAAAVQLGLVGLPPYVWLVGLGEGLAWVLTVALAVLMWALLILPMRMLSTMPTHAEELAAAGAADMKELYDQQQRRILTDKRRNNLRWHGMMALTGALVSVILGLVVAVFWFAEGVLFVALAIGAVASGAVAVGHCTQVARRLVHPRVERDAPP